MTAPDGNPAAAPRQGRISAVGRFARLGFADASAAETGWRSVGLPDDAVLGLFAQAADPDLAVRSLVRVLEAAGPAAEELRTALTRSDGLARRLAMVLGASAALGDHLARHPEDWRELAAEDLDDTRPTAAAIAAELTAAGDPDRLRRSYRRLLLRLAARDLGGRLEVDDVAGELADLAAGALEGALRLAREDLGNAAASCRLGIVGLGKCGARELNYVSDVDVLFVAEPAPGAAEADALKAATALAAATMRICSGQTREGTLWPVDAGLRPEGDAGPLVRTLASHRAYYDRWAKTWEFQALLKARPIAGDMELATTFTDAVSPLVWSAADRAGFVADVQAMRRRVVDELPAGEAQRQLKLGPGGLRDVEFAVQLLQLVHGRADKALRVPHTLQALAALTAGGYVGRDDGTALGAAYRFLRTLEHRLQLRRLRRTHVVPSDDAALRALGRSLGFTSRPAQELVDAWQAQAREVRRLHEKLFYRPLLTAVAALPSEQARLSPEAARRRLEALGYADPAAALRHLEALTGGVSRRAAIQRALLPAMLGWFAEAPDPDAGLLGFRRLSEALGNSHGYLRMLRDEGASAQRLARLLATSRYAGDLLMRAPEATDLLARDEMLLPRDGAALAMEFEEVAGRHDDPVDAVTAVRALRRRELFRVAAGDLSGLLDVEQVGRALTGVATATVRAAFAAATAEVERQIGERLPSRLAVIGLGRLGGAELAYGSDADVLFVHEPVTGAGDQAAQDASTAVATELRRLLALPGPDPALSVDADLRPEGRQGPLVRSLSSYESYYRRWSHGWEAQALLRASPLAGDGELTGRFLRLADAVRYPAAGLAEADVAEIRRVKARVDAERLPRGADPATHVKLGRGGLADIEWTVQLLQLRFAHAVAALRTPQTLAALNAAREVGLVDEQQCTALAAAWRLASRVRNAVMLVRGRPADVLPTEPRERAAVAMLCGYRLGEAGRFGDDYLRTARHARAAVDAVFWSG